MWQYWYKPSSVWIVENGNYCLLSDYICKCDNIRRPSGGSDEWKPQCNDNFLLLCHMERNQVSIYDIEHIYLYWLTYCIIMRVCHELLRVCHELFFGWKQKSNHALDGEIVWVLGARLRFLCQSVLNFQACRSTPVAVMPSSK